MKRIPLLAGLIGGLPAFAHAQTALDLAPITVNGEEQPTTAVYARFVHVSPAWYLGEPRTFELAVQTRF